MGGKPFIPGQTPVETTFADGPLAQPTVVTMNGRDGIKILTIGGLSKVESLAGQIAGTLAMPGVLARYEPHERISCIKELDGTFGEDRTKAFEALVATNSVNIAEAILAECAKRVQQTKPDLRHRGEDQENK